MAAGTLSVAQLQAHYHELNSHMPVLPISILPRSQAASLAAVESDAAAAKVIKRARAGVNECQICSSSCDSSEHLQLLLSTNLDFQMRAVTATAARLACPACVAASSSSLLLQLSTPLTAAYHDAERAEQLQQLYLHIAAVNGAPAHITSNPEALAVWVQELACRAYGLSLTASSLRGWHLQPACSSTAQLLKMLLSNTAAAATAAAAAAVGPAAAAATGSKHKHKKGHAAATVKGQQQQQQQQPAEVQQVATKRKGSMAGAAAGLRNAADAATPAKKPKAAAAAVGGTPKSATSQQQQQPALSRAKQSRKQQAATGAATSTAGGGSRSGVVSGSGSRQQVKSAPR